MESQEERSCLQLAAKRGGCLSSPWYAGLELLAAICSAGRACGLPLRPVTTDVVELPATTTRIKGLCGSSSVVSPVDADLVKLAAGSGTGPNAPTRRGAPTTMRTRVMTATAEPVPKPSYKYTAPPLVKLQTGTEPSETLSLNAGIRLSDCNAHGLNASAETTPQANGRTTAEDPFPLRGILREAVHALLAQVTNETRAGLVGEAAAYDGVTV